MLEKIKLLGACDTKGSRQLGGYELRFREGESHTSVNVCICDTKYNGLVIEHFNVYPTVSRGNGVGKRSLARLVSGALSAGYKDIYAVQVQRQSAGFWEKGGFVRLSEPNPTNDYKYRLP